MARFYKLPLLLGATLMVVASTGCIKNSFETGLRPVRATYEQRLTYFFFGLVPTKSYNLDDFCPDGKVAQVRTKMTFGNALAHLFTFQLYTPRTMEVTCGSGTYGSMVEPQTHVAYSGNLPGQEGVQR